MHPSHSFKVGNKVVYYHSDSKCWKLCKIGSIIDCTDGSRRYNLYDNDCRFFTVQTNHIKSISHIIRNPKDIIQVGRKCRWYNNTCTIVYVPTDLHYSIIMVDDMQDSQHKSYHYLSDYQKSEIDKLNIPDCQNKKFVVIDNDVLEFLNSVESFNKNPQIKSETRTKESKMSNKIVETLKTDAQEAAYRVASTQITNGVKAGVVKLFESKGGKSEQMEMLKGVLDSEVGESLIALLLGYGLSYAPHLKNDPRVQKLAEEFRVSGMTVAGNAVVGAAMENILPVISGVLENLPEETSSKPRVVEASEESEEEEEVPPARISKTAGS